MLYVDYTFYKQIYKGDVLNEEQFEKYAVQALNFIINLTNNRISEQNISENIKLAICSAADVFWQKAQSAPVDISAESTDGYSVNYQSSNARQSAWNYKLISAVNLYFSPAHPLRYKGALHEYPQ